jgi:hypothetical protein
VFLIFYRCAYLGIALYIGLTEFRKDGDLIEAAVFSLFIAVALELLYWLRELKARTPQIVLGWIGKREERKQQQKAASELPGGTVHLQMLTRSG